MALNLVKAPTIVGTPYRRQGVTVDIGEWSKEVTPVKFVWYVDDLPMEETPTGEFIISNMYPIGAELKVGVYVTDGTDEANATTTAVTILASPPVNLELPTITGMAKVGHTLTGNVGTWTNNSANATVTHRWLANGDPVTGATTTTFFIDPDGDYRDQILTFEVTVTNEDGQAQVSIDSDNILPGNPFVVGDDTVIVGEPEVGTELTLIEPQWDEPDLTVSYRWQLDREDIPGATGPTYVVQASDVGKALRAIVCVENAFGTNESTNDEVYALDTWPVCVVAPSISGIVKIGKTLTANIGEWTGSNLVFTYEWWSDGSIISTSPSLGLLSALAGKSVLLTVKASNSRGNAMGDSAPTGAITLAMGNTTPPQIVGEALVGNTLSVTPGTWTAPVVSYAYQWLRDGAPIEGATTSTYLIVNADYDAYISCTVTATDADDDTSQVTTSPTAKVSATELQLVKPLFLPSIVSIGSTVQLGRGQYNHAIVQYEYEWFVANVMVPDNSEDSYEVQPGDYGKQLRANETVTDIFGRELTTSSNDAFVSNNYSIAVSDPVGPVVLDIQFLTDPVITGDLLVGNVLTVSDGTTNFQPVRRTYQWYRDGEAVQDETDESYITTAADAGATLSVTVDAWYDLDYKVSKTVQASGPIEGATPANLTPPTLPDTANIGSSIEANVGTWTEEPTSYRVRWLIDGQQVQDGASTTYAIEDDVSLVDKSIMVQVWATKAGATSEMAQSNAVVIKTIPPSNVTRPTISGDPIVGSTLSYSGSEWEGDSPVITQEWLADGVVVATTPALVLTLAHEGKMIDVRLTATNSAGSVSVTAIAPVGPVVNVPPVNTTKPLITGDLVVGSTLSTTNGTWTNIPVSYAIQWYADGELMDGQESSTYVLAADDIGKMITARVTATNSGGSTSAVSDAVGPVEDTPVIVPVNLTPPVITGDLIVGSTIECTRGTWENVTDAVYTYQWFSEGVAIEGATSASLLLTQDLGTKTVRVRVTATTDNGAGSACSEPTDVIDPNWPEEGTILQTKCVGKDKVFVIADGAGGTYEEVSPNSPDCGFAPPVNTVVPLVVGEPKIGNTLESTNGTWTGTMPMTYAAEWLLDGVSTSVTTASFTLTAEMIGKKVSVTIHATNEDGTTDATSAETAEVFDNYPPQGTLLSKRCEGQVLLGIYANGTGGTYEAVIEINSLECNWTPPPVAGTVLETRCDGTTKVEVQANGRGGSYSVYIPKNVDCGYTDYPSNEIDEMIEDNKGSDNYTLRFLAHVLGWYRDRMGFLKPSNAETLHGLQLNLWAALRAAVFEEEKFSECMDFILSVFKENRDGAFELMMVLRTIRDDDSRIYGDQRDAYIGMMMIYTWAGRLNDISEVKNHVDLEASVSDKIFSEDARMRLIGYFA